MGLDIYLSRRIFIGAMYRSRAITGKIELFSFGKPIPVKLELLASVTEDIYHGSKTWWLWEWFNHEAPELIEANGLEHVISVDTLQKLCRTCEEVLSAKGTEAFSALCGNQLHYPVRKEIAPDDLLNLVQEIEELVRVLKDIEQQPDIDFHLAVSW